MAHLPIRKKAEAPKAINLLPMAAILAVGVVATLSVDGARRGPVEVAQDLREQAQPLVAQALKPHEGGGGGGPALPVHALGELSGRTLTAGGHAWVLAAAPEVTDFQRDEMQLQAQTGGWVLLANVQRGLTSLNPNAHAYDRLYVDLGNNRYAPLRWRDVPPHR